MNEALAAKLKDLHLGELLTHWDDYLKLAGDQRFSHGRLLTHIVEEQYRVKRERLRELRLRKAHVPEPWVIETFPFDRQPKLNEKKIMALYDSLTYMVQSQNIVWLGGPRGRQDRFGYELIADVTCSFTNCSPSSPDPAPIIPKPNCLLNI